MKDKLKVLKNYDKNTHLQNLYMGKMKELIKLKNLNYIYSNEWDKGSNYPYVPITHLLDSYYCLPERPDMAFTFLWKAINSVYNIHYLIKAGQGESISGVSITGREGDGKKLECILESISNNLNDKIVYQGNSFTLIEIIDLYIEKMPIKTLRFVSSYILKGLVIDNQLNYSGITGNMKNTYLTSQYKTFKSTFDDLFQIIRDTYGNSYLNIATLVSNTHNSQIDVISTNKEKSRAITHSLSAKLKEMLINKSTEITDSNNVNYTLIINNDLEFLKFVFNAILYAIRNTSFHGNAASRYNSRTFDEESIESSTYIYLLGHLLLSLCLYVNGEIKADELGINIENLNLL